MRQFCTEELCQRPNILLQLETRSQTNPQEIKQMIPNPTPSPNTPFTPPLPPMLQLCQLYTLLIPQSISQSKLVCNKTSFASTFALHHSKYNSNFVMLCCGLPSPGEVRNGHSMFKVSFCTPVSCRQQAPPM